MLGASLQDVLAGADITAAEVTYLRYKESGVAILG